MKLLRFILGCIVFMYSMHKIEPNASLKYSIGMFTGILIALF